MGHDTEGSIRLKAGNFRTFFSHPLPAKINKCLSSAWTQGGKYQSAFPFNVICTTWEQATELNDPSVHDAFDELEKIPTTEEQIDFVKQSPILADLLPDEREVYAVVYGHRKGIYFNW